jgi:hypothetical protein
MGERWKSKERKLKTDEYVEKLLASQKSIKTEEKNNEGDLRKF